MRWAFMPNTTHVQSTQRPRPGPLDATTFWKLTASAMLLLAVAHGVHGLVVIADDYISRRAGADLVRLVSIVFMLGMIGRPAFMSSGPHRSTR